MRWTDELCSKRLGVLKEFLAPQGSGVQLLGLLGRNTSASIRAAVCASPGLSRRNSFDTITQRQQQSRDVADQ